MVFGLYEKDKKIKEFKHISVYWEIILYESSAAWTINFLLQLLKQAGATSGSFYRGVVDAVVFDVINNGYPYYSVHLNFSETYCNETSNKLTS